MAPLYNKWANRPEAVLSGVCGDARKSRNSLAVFISSWKDDLHYDEGVQTSVCKRPNVSTKFSLLIRKRALLTFWKTKSSSSSRKGLVSVALEQTGALLIVIVSFQIMTVLCIFFWISEQWRMQNVTDGWAWIKSRWAWIYGCSEIKAGFPDNVVS